MLWELDSGVLFCFFYKTPNTVEPCSQQVFWAREYWYVITLTSCDKTLFLQLTIGVINYFFSNYTVLSSIPSSFHIYLSIYNPARSFANGFSVVQIKSQINIIFHYFFVVVSKFKAK